MSVNTTVWKGRLTSGWSPQPAWRRSPWLGRGTLIAAVAVAAVIPAFVSNDATLFEWTTILLWMTIGLAWNWVAGFSGRLDLAFGAYYAVGAYVTAYLAATQSWPPVLAVVGGAAAAGICAGIIGPAFLKLKGLTFSIATLSVFIAAQQLAPLLTVIGGGAGLTLPASGTRVQYWYVFAGLALVTIVVTHLIRRSQFGLALRARREDELSADSRGINLVGTQITIYTMMGITIGVVGGIWALQNGFVSPEVVFTQSLLEYVLIIVLIGGIGTVAGPIVGATLFILVSDLLWSSFLDFHDLILAVLLVGIALVAPDGLNMPTWRRLMGYLRRDGNSKTDAAGDANATT
jgi:branched-chain amino acid transport system permease protein